MAGFSPSTLGITYGSLLSLIRETLIGAGAIRGNDGKSAYQLWIDEGNTGSLNDFLESLVGEDGKSAYNLAVDAGFSGTLAEWLVSLKGEKGDPGEGVPGGGGQNNLNWRGTWSSSPGVTYAKDDLVFHQSSYYVAKSDVPYPQTGSPSSDTAHWRLFFSLLGTTSLGTTATNLGNTQGDNTVVPVGNITMRYGTLEPGTVIYDGKRIGVVQSISTNNPSAFVMTVQPMNAIPIGRITTTITAAPGSTQSVPSSDYTAIIGGSKAAGNYVFDPNGSMAVITGLPVRGSDPYTITVVSNMQSNVGLLTDLQTTDKTSIVAAINELKARIDALENP
jgi:hypothetical protein